ncbi:MAG: tRNA (adenosine(37)-N6)-threonylcarbamoyltransferase complex transferase subunit TsaD, partial [Erysipelotrichaceae bacterium]|nr:tRNA (adenosine(37)-N6)-threonylcarbamoyltransferase complex transferase subunit TsaD [Erysipelotrichaceae bacterium]
MDALAEEGDPHSLPLPVPHTAGPYDYSFSGVKTAFLNAVHRLEQRGEELPRADLAASFRQAVCGQLTEKAMQAARDTGT